MTRKTIRILRLCLPFVWLYMGKMWMESRNAITFVYIWAQCSLLSACTYMKNGFAPNTLRTNRKRTNKSMSEHKKQETMLILCADMRVCASEKIGSTCGDNDNEQCSPKIEYCVDTAWGMVLFMATKATTTTTTKMVVARVSVPAAASGASDMRFWFEGRTFNGYMCTSFAPHV